MIPSLRTPESCNALSVISPQVLWRLDHRVLMDNFIAILNLLGTTSQVSGPSRGQSVDSEWVIQFLAIRP